MNSKSMAGWIGFGGLVMILLGGLAFFQGLIAVIEDDYYVVSRSGFLVFDLTGWGWTMMIWGIILVLVGLAPHLRPELGPVGVDRPRQRERVRTARLRRQQQLPAVDADGADAGHHRAVRAHREMGREPAAAGGRIERRSRRAGHRVLGPPPAGAEGMIRT